MNQGPRYVSRILEEKEMDRKRAIHNAKRDVSLALFSGAVANRSDMLPARKEDYVAQIANLCSVSSING